LGRAIYQIKVKEQLKILKASVSLLDRGFFVIETISSKMAKNSLGDKPSGFGIKIKLKTKKGGASWDIWLKIVLGKSDWEKS
jgi:hypothetical protein